MLPKIDQPLYSLTLPYTKKTVQYRPFLVKEEKLLLMAAQGKEQSEITKSIWQVVNNCLVAKSDIKVEELPGFEIDLLFLHMRAKSIGDKVEQEFTCNNLIESDKKCGHVFVVPLTLSDVIITAGPQDTILMLTDKMGVKMKYPKFKTYDVESAEVGYDMIIDCLDSVFDSVQNYSFRDQSREEIIEWIENLTKEQFQKLQAYYDALPALELHKRFECVKCGFKHEMELDDPLSFF